MKGIIMKSILEELFYGNVSPQEDCAISDEKTEQLKGFIAYHHATLSSTLTDQQKEIFEKFNDCVSELTDICDRDTFVYAFKLGMKIAIETFLDCSDENF